MKIGSKPLTFYVLDWTVKQFDYLLICGFPIWSYIIKCTKKHQDFDSLFRAQCEEAVMAVGLDFKSDVLWERLV